MKVIQMCVLLLEQFQYTDDDVVDVAKTRRLQRETCFSPKTKNKQTPTAQHVTE